MLSRRLVKSLCSLRRIKSSLDWSRWISSNHKPDWNTFGHNCGGRDNRVVSYGHSRTNECVRADPTPITNNAVWSKQRKIRTTVVMAPITHMLQKIREAHCICERQCQSPYRGRQFLPILLSHGPQVGQTRQAVRSVQPPPLGPACQCQCQL